jgi:3-deoxy-manno-octulosonate cytidylyltransferase (CMP-KDO synthetase)
MKTAAGVIPARWQSTRFAGKPLHLIAGKPLLRHVFERSRKAKCLDRLVIATDDVRIARAASDWGAEVAFTSPTHPSGTDRVAEVADRLSDVAFIVNIQGDEPLIDPKLIDRVVHELRADPKLEMITAAHLFSDPSEASSPHQVKVVLDRLGNALYFSRSPIPFHRTEARRGMYLRHQGIYGYTRDLLLRLVRWQPSALEKVEGLEQLRAIENGVKIHVLLTSHGSPGVDTLEDAKALERQFVAARRRDKTLPRSGRR